MCLFLMCKKVCIGICVNGLTNPSSVSMETHILRPLTKALWLYTYKCCIFVTKVSCLFIFIIAGYSISTLTVH